MDGDLLRAWIRQARADLGAGCSLAGEECHRRYWLQQACEKALKAFGLILWHGPEDDSVLRRRFLLQHSPLSVLAAEPDLPKPLRALVREIKAELGQMDNGKLLLQLEGTTPTTNATDVSYRYPFVDTDGNARAPADWTATDWNAYQGNAQGLSAALSRFLDRIERRRRLSRR